MQKPPSRLWQWVILIAILLALTTFLTRRMHYSKAIKEISKLYKPSPDTDVSTSPYYNFSQFSGTIWKTKVRTAVADLKRYSGAQDITLLTPVSFDATDPKYNPPPTMKGFAELPVGTRLRIERLMKDNGAAGFVMVTATLLDGTNSQNDVFLAQHFVAKNRFVWPGWSASTNWDADSDILEKP
jgi:hypothetical protein